MEKLIEISNLSKSFKKDEIHALKDINAEISSGKIIGIIGPDGAGKTTLLRLLTGLLKPTIGNIKVLNFDTAKEIEKIYPYISYMPQKFGLYEDLTVIQNLNLYAELYNVAFDEKEKIFEYLLKFTSLKPFVNRLAKKLSGGMKQKLGLACTLIRKPKILFLDEPSVGVDPVSRRELWSMVRKLTEENITILWSTSYLDEAEKCEEVLVLNEGNLLYKGSPADLTKKMNGKTFLIENISNNKRALLRKILQNENVIDGVIQGNAIRVVFKDKKNDFDLKKLDPNENASLIETNPRFEDAFVNMIGAVSKEPSIFLKKYKKEIFKNSHPAVEVKNLEKKFGNFTAVNNISFSVKRGEIFGLLGPNGAGKSTTFKMLCDLIKPTNGDAFITGISIKNVKSNVRQLLGYMAQKFSLYENMNALQNLNFFSGIYPIKSEEKNTVVDEMIKVFYLKPYITIPSSKLPLGFKQRLALACATMHEPQILFLDEPTSGVDPLTRREFWTHINALVEKGVAIVITTHFMDEAEYCDRIALINKGTISRIGTPDELKKAAASKEVKNPTLEDAFIILSSEKQNK